MSETQSGITLFLGKSWKLLLSFQAQTTRVLTGRVLRWRLLESFFVKGLTAETVNRRKLWQCCHLLFGRGSVCTCVQLNYLKAYLFDILRSSECVLDHCLSFSTFQRNLNALPFTKLNVNDPITGRKLLPAPRLISIRGRGSLQTHSAATLNF